MKKSIFDLEKKELKEIRKETLKTNYGKLYNIFLTTTLITAIIFFILVFVELLEEIIINNEETKLINISHDLHVVILFLCVFLNVICQFKVFDLMKKYFDEKVLKKEF